MAQAWIRADNPFGLDPPPEWWLKELALFDPQLRIFPSQKRATFILARVATRSAGESPHDVKGLTQNPDTLFMAARRLVRVCDILPGVIWDQRIFQKLAAHDIQRLGGGKQVANLLDDRDNRISDRIQRDQTDTLDAIGHSAWRGYQHRTGSLISLANPHGRGTVNRKPIHFDVGKSASPSPRPGERLIIPA